MNQSVEEDNGNVHPMVKKIEKARRDARQADDDEQEDDDQNVELNDIHADYGGNPYAKYQGHQDY